MTGRHQISFLHRRGRPYKVETRYALLRMLCSFSTGLKGAYHLMLFSCNFVGCIPFFWKTPVVNDFVFCIMYILISEMRLCLQPKMTTGL